MRNPFLYVVALLGSVICIIVSVSGIVCALAGVLEITRPHGDVHLLPIGAAMYFGDRARR